MRYAALLALVLGCSCPHEMEAPDSSITGDATSPSCAEAGVAAVDATVDAEPTTDAAAPTDSGIITSPPFIVYAGAYVALCDSRCKYTSPSHVEIAGHRLGAADIDNAGEGGLTMRRLDDEFESIAKPHIIGDGGVYWRVCSLQGGYDDELNENADASATGAHYQSIVTKMRDAGCDYVLSLLEVGGVNLNPPWLDPYRAMQAEAGADDVEDPCGDVWRDAWYGDGGGGQKIQPWSVDGLHGSRVFEACAGDALYGPLVRAFRASDASL